MKSKFKTISKDGAGRITSKLTKPKDWAHRTPGEGRPKLVISGRAKQIPMNTELVTSSVVANLLLSWKTGTRYCDWNVSCLNPARKLSAQDVLDIVHNPNESFFQIQINRGRQIFLFEDLSGIISGGHSPEDKRDKQIGKRNSNQCFVCGHKKSKCTCEK